MHDAIKAIDDRFKSGNDIPVTRASITADEWIAVKNEIERLLDVIYYQCSLLDEAVKD